MKKAAIVWAGIAIIIAIIFTLQAQETAISIRPIIIHVPVSSTSDDLNTMLEAVEATTPTPAASVPVMGTFQSAQNPLWPPLPGNLNNTPAWNLGDGTWLLDDLDVNYSPVRLSSGGGGMHAMEESGPPSPGDGGGDGGTNTFYGSPAPAVDYGTNLWIAQVAVISNNFVGIGTNTLADIQYEIQSRTNLLQTNWESEGFILGSELTNWTPLSVAENGRTNLFLRLRSWADDGSGLPIWWQLQYFGYIGVDPYADPDGDGWNNLQEFQNGTDPNFYDEPPTPPDTNAPPPTFTLVSGPLGHFYVIGAGLPSDLSAIRIFRHGHPGTSAWSYGNGTNFPVDLPDGYFDIPVASITNGIAQIPPSEAYAFGNYIFQVEAMQSNGVNETTNYLGVFFNSVFVDGRAQLKDNLRFLLRAAGGDGPFEANGIVQPTDYVYSGFYDSSADFDPLTPFENNYLYRNFEFDLNNLCSSNYFASLSDPNFYFVLVGIPRGIQLGHDFDPNYYRDINTVDLTYAIDFAPFITTNNPVAPSSWNTSQARWLFPPSSNDYIDGFPGGSNWFGLSYLSELSPYYTNNEFLTATFYPDAPPTSPPGGFYLETDQPDFQTVDYYFARAGIDPMPEQGAYVGYSSPTFFATTNTTPMLIAGVGQSMPQLAGYAKLAVTNGNSGMYAYFGQYFDTAYRIDTNGVTTTNTTGVLSPYGNFYATEPGPVALVTMPDIDTGERGTATVYCASMQVDKNSDGVMDLSFNGADATSQSSPMECWVNNGHDQAGSYGNLDTDLEVPPALPNYSTNKITCPRDLENFFRLWICGVPSLPLYENYTFTLSMSPVSGNPAVNIYASCETNGGIGYLTNSTVAAQQADISTSTSYGISMGTVSNGSPCTIPSIAFAFGGTQHFLFEGAGIGEGQLTLTISDSNSNTVAQTSVWLDLHDIKDFFEQDVIQDSMSGAKSNWTSYVETILPAIASGLGNDTNIIVLVHGINVRPWDCIDDAGTVCKRLYWAGFHGKFTEVEWPCNLLTPIPDPLSPAVFNDSELQGYKASTALTTCLNGLKTRFPNYRLNILAHSQGNAVVSEAIKNGAPFDTYILTQGALPDSAYDVNATNDPDLLGLSPTPESQPMGYLGIYTNSNFAGRIVNFYNPQDKVLSYWVDDQEYLKPSTYRDTSYYFYDGTNSYYDPFIGFNYLVTDPEESRAEVSRSLTLSIGQSGPASTHGVIKAAVDLNAQFGFVNTIDDHSAQWTRPIQMTGGYYLQILTSINP